MYNNKLLIRTYTGTYTEIFLNACCTHKNCRFGEVSFLTPVYKSSRISATQRPIRNKFGTNVEKGRLVRNPQKKWKFFVPTYGPFPCGRSHIGLDGTNSNIFWFFVFSLIRCGYHSRTLLPTLDLEKCSLQLQRHFKHSHVYFPTRVYGEIIR